MNIKTFGGLNSKQIKKQGVTSPNLLQNPALHLVATTEYISFYTYIVNILEIW